MQIGLNKKEKKTVAMVGSHVTLGLKGQGEMELTEPSESHSIVSGLSGDPMDYNSPWNS